MPYHSFAQKTGSSTVTTKFGGEQFTTVTHNNSKACQSGSLADVNLASIFGSLKEDSSNSDEDSEEDGLVRRWTGQICNP
jgi:hypothetical protein